MTKRQVFNLKLSFLKVSITTSLWWTEPKFYFLFESQTIRMFFATGKLKKLIGERDKRGAAFYVFTIWNLAAKKEDDLVGIQAAAALLGSNCNYKAGAAFFRALVNPLITILYVMSLWLKRERSFERWPL